MATPPIFQRTTRITQELPSGEVEIPAPPTAPSKPSTSLLTILLPAAGTILGLGLMIGIGAATYQSTGGAGLAISMLVSIPMMLATYLTSFINHAVQKKKYKEEVEKRQEGYGRMLAARRQELIGSRNQQQTVLCQTDPDLHECVSRVERLDRRLWDRSPQDADFLSLRLGLGTQPFSVKVKPPKEQTALEADPLIEAAQNLAREFAHVPDVPVCLPLREAGAAGLAGPRHAVLNAARALAIQIATHHSPDEVRIVAVFPASEAAYWEWLRWLPHTWTDDRSQRFLACEKDTAHQLLLSLYDLLNRRLLQMTTAKSTSDFPLPCLVFFLADPLLVENEPILRLLLRQGKALGAFTVFLADRSEALPQGCGAITEAGDGQGKLIQTLPLPAQTTFRPDEAAIELADRLARAMAPIRLQSLATSSEIPNVVPLLNLLGVDRVEHLGVESRWRSSKPHQSLAVPIGKRSGGESLLLDLHERGHGPHGLVAGMTRSGKTAFLSAFIALFSTYFDPHEVTFVAIDYKGGDLVRDLKDLPHLVGVISNLQGNLADRALQALKAEAQRRQRIFNEVGVGDIYTYQKRRRAGEKLAPLPHLVVISDEFAELAKEQPDFIRELVSTARVGGSLGIHLILATQQPAGVVNDQIWGNARFRICFKFGRDEDSKAVLKRPDAAMIVQPGRAYLQVGENEVFELFQAAWGGMPYTPGGHVASDPYEIVEVALDGSRRQRGPASRPAVSQATGTQLQALVRHLRDVAAKEGITRLQGPWLEPLPERVMLETVQPKEGWNGQEWQPVQKWMEAVIGLVDNPASQYQGPLSINLGREGHLAIYGAPGTGKTTLVQTLVTSLALTHSPQDVHMYLLDFGGRLLTLFSSLPHVGGVILTDEAQRLNRLLRYLLQELDSRKEKFARAGVSTLASYRSTTNERLPAIVVVLDNYTGFVNTYPDAEEPLAQIAREGGNLGVHLVVTANGPSMIKAKVGNSITMAVTLQLTERSDYSVAVGRTGGLEPAPLPGRGLVKGNPPLEFQTALPARGDTDAQRTAELKNLIEQMTQLGGDRSRARPVPEMPDIVPACSLFVPRESWPPVPADGTLAVPLGLEVEDLEPLTVDLNEGPHFLITGPAQSGKTTFLQTWLLALAEQFPPQRLHLYLVDFRRAGLWLLRRLPHVQAYIENDDQLGMAAAEIGRVLHERRRAWDEVRQTAGGPSELQAWLSTYPAIVVAIDDFDAFRDGTQMGTRERLEQLARRERGLGFHISLAGASTDLAFSADGPVKAVKELQTGFLLGSNEHNDLQVLNIRLPMSEAGIPMAPGEGYYSRRGRYRKIKAATCQRGDLTLVAWVERIRQRASA